MPYKKEKQKSESVVRILQCMHLRHLEEEGNCRGVAAEANSQLQPDACWTSVNCASDFKGEKEIKEHVQNTDHNSVSYSRYVLDDRSYTIYVFNSFFNIIRFTILYKTLVCDGL